MRKPKLIQEPPQAESTEMIWLIRRDLPQVVAIEADLFPHAWTEEKFVDFLRQRNSIGMVYRIDDTVVGYVIYTLHKRRLHIENLAVRRDFQRQGIGRAMVDRLYQKLSQQKRTALSCDVWDANTDAHLFLQKCGFNCRQINRDFYENGGDSYVFYKFLNPSSKETT